MSKVLGHSALIAFMATLFYFMISVALFDVVYDFSLERDTKTINIPIGEESLTVYDGPPPVAQSGRDAVKAYIRNPELLIEKSASLLLIFVIVFFSTLWATYWTRKILLAPGSQPF